MAFFVAVHFKGLVTARLATKYDASSLLFCTMARYTHQALLVCVFLGLGIMDFQAQENSPLKFANLPVIDEEPSADFFVRNRNRLRDTMGDSVVVVLLSAPQKTRSNDIDYRYHQDPDFYYFTGIEEPNSMLLLFKDSVEIDGEWLNEILFVESKNVKKERWTGRMLGLAEAKEVSGAANVMSNIDFISMPIPFKDFDFVYSNANQWIERDDKEHPGDLMSMDKHLKAKAERAGVQIKVNAAEDLFGFLRQHKSAEEIAMLQQAIDITCEAQKNAMRSIVPGMTEYQVEALIEYTFRSNGASGAAFPSIVAGGSNGGIMHYTSNESLLIPGDLVVIDIGAEYEGYAADVTRTIPIDGTFSAEQAIIYQIVLDAQSVAIRYATPGYKFWTPHEEAFRTIGKGLIKNGIITQWSEIGDYFIHGTSHYLGLDVHDSGIYSSLQPGEVITIEPGIYIPHGSPCDPKWWDIYVRIEDDILITAGAAKLLSSGAPKKISEIEKIMDRGQASAD